METITTTTVEVINPQENDTTQQENNLVPDVAPTETTITETIIQKIKAVTFPSIVYFDTAEEGRNCIFQKTNNIWSIRYQPKGTTQKKFLYLRLQNHTVAYGSDEWGTFATLIPIAEKLETETKAEIDALFHITDMFTNVFQQQFLADEKLPVYRKTFNYDNFRIRLPNVKGSPMPEKDFQKFLASPGVIEISPAYMFMMKNDTSTGINIGLKWTLNRYKYNENRVPRSTPYARKRKTPSSSEQESKKTDFTPNQQGMPFYEEEEKKNQESGLV